jgi:2',3'-cyclic-nucleotide 2'-phosphodiesterase (5'-nucleotidase family)
MSDDRDQPTDHDESQQPVRLLHYADLESVYDHPELVGRLAGCIDDRRGDDALVLGSGDTTALCSLSFCSDDGRGVAREFFEAVRPDADTFGNHDFDHGPDWLAAFAASTPQRWLCANVEDFPGDVAGSEVFEVDDRRVGVVGLAHPDTASLSHATDCSFDEPVATAREAAAACRNRGAEHVVICSHAGAADAAIARNVDADVILGGHDHEHVTERIDGTLLVRRPAGAHLVEFELGGEPTVRDLDVAGAPVDESVADAYRDRRDRLGLDEVVTRLGEPLDRPSVAGFVTDAYREVAGADVGLAFEASVRRRLDGQVTTADVIGVAPFGSDLVELRVPGRDLREALLAGRTAVDDTHGRLVSGGATVRDEAVFVGGERLEPDRGYDVAAMSYLSHADVLSAFSRDRVVASHGPQHEALLAHARDGGLDVACERRRQSR